MPSSKTMSWAAKVTQLMDSSLYRNLVLRLVKDYTEAGHKILVVSDRVEFLKYGAKNSKNAVTLVGDDSEDVRDLNLKSLHDSTTSVWGTQNIVSEGLSEDIFSCLILCTPVNNEPLLEQLIGRIQRLRPGKLAPIVIDIRLIGHAPDNQFNTRLGHYITQGYKMINIT